MIILCMFVSYNIMGKEYFMNIPSFLRIKHLTVVLLPWEPATHWKYKLIYYYILHFLQQKLYGTSAVYMQAILIVLQRKLFRFPSIFSSRNRSRLTRMIYQIEKCLALTIKTLLHMMFLCYSGGWFPLPVIWYITAYLWSHY